MSQAKLSQPEDFFEKLKRRCKTKEDFERLEQLKAIKGSLKKEKPTTDEDLRRIREEVFKEFEEKFRLSPPAS